MCIEYFAHYFLENELLLNPAKMEAVLFGTEVPQEKITTASSISIMKTIMHFCDTGLGSDDGPT